MESKLTRSGKEEEEEDVELPGFRFYPTDEELTGFYLRRKAQKKHSSAIEFIKQIDIYMYDPWDLPSEFHYFGSFFIIHIASNDSLSSF